jgi:rod shape-determining protein MreC
MFSKKLLTIVCLVLFALANIIFLSINAKHRRSDTLLDHVVMSAVAPFQAGAIRAISACEYVWRHYFYLVSVTEECDRLRAGLEKATMKINEHAETERTCQRLKELLGMKASLPQRLVPAQVVGLEPLGWYKSVIINRGSEDGVAKGMPVVTPNGIVGQIVTTSYGYAKVMLMVDRSSGIDGLVQRNRTRGIVEGETDETCRFKYVVRNAEIEVGDIVVSSGLDGVFPKGLQVGSVVEVSKNQPDIFQEVKIRPFVDFSRLEEVLVIVDDSKQEDPNKVQPDPEKP